jgi:hypothetical protein
LGLLDVAFPRLVAYCWNRPFVKAAELNGLDEVKHGLHLMNLTVYQALVRISGTGSLIFSLWEFILVPLGRPGIP